MHTIRIPYHACIDIATDHNKELRSSVALIGSARVYHDLCKCY